MKIENIIIYGSTYITELVCKKLSSLYNLIGHVPCKNPKIPGKINLPIITGNETCDLRLSIQYDRMIKNVTNTYNLHTGLLPEYGGTNILDYTIKHKEKEQGLTLHKITETLDYGPIVSKITYPVLDTDRAFDLYKRVMLLSPNFVLSSLDILKQMQEEDIQKLQMAKPTIYKRGEFNLSNEFVNLIGELNER